MAQQSRGQVLLTAAGVDHAAVGQLGHGVDGQITTLQILFQRDIRREVTDEAVVAAALLALGAGQRIFVLTVRVQEDGEIVADLAIALCQQVLGRGAHDHPVDIDHGQAEQAITDCATDAISLIAHCNPGRL